MTTRPPAEPGAAVDAIDTPALLLDLDAFERNLDAMSAAARESGKRLRPHAKSHKCPAIAHAQIARGAVGICCQKTDEAAAFVADGIYDVLVTNEVVHPAKLARLARLAHDARIGVLADDASAIPALQRAARSEDVKLDVYVEVDVGAHRCGVPPGAPAVALARAVVDSPSLRFAGLQCYQGAAQHRRTPAERRDAIVAAARMVHETKDALQRAGLDCPLVTGAGTGTWPLESELGAWDELQAGSYVFMDADYGRNLLGPGDIAFEQSLFVIASVMSVPAHGRAICDAGLKAFSFDSGPPLVHGRHDVEYTKASDEHGVLAIADGAASPALNERIRLVPGHCDPTVNLYDWIVGYRNGRVEQVWPVAARGALG